VYKFCQRLEAETKQNTSGRVAVCAEQNRHSLTNVVFLLGAYMIIRLDYTPTEVGPVFERIRGLLLSYRDVLSGKQNFDLQLKDCWEGVWQATRLGWVDFGPNGFDAHEYNHLGSPINADMHQVTNDRTAPPDPLAVLLPLGLTPTAPPLLQVVPGKFIAMKGPRRLDEGREWMDRRPGVRDFSPRYLADILRQFDAQVR
jgi:hypothetical protein